jgi:hypothetical protein
MHFKVRNMSQEISTQLLEKHVKIGKHVLAFILLVNGEQRSIKNLRLYYVIGI